MTAAALNAQALLPRPPGGNGPGAALALAVHAALLLALTVSVDWRSRPTDVVAAELWASVPQVAAPPPPPAPEPKPEPQPVPPQPTPRVAEPPPRAADADIAIERDRRKAEAERKKREEAERRVAEEKKKREEEAREAREAKAQDRAQEKRLAELREAQMRRMMGDAATAGSGRTGSATQDAAPSAAYAGRVAALIRRASVFTGSVSGNPATEVEVRTGAGGTIIARRIVKSSGHPPWDEAVLQAIDKVGTLPRDSDGRVPPQLIVAFRPKDE